MHNRIVCTCVASPHCGWACAFSGVQHDQINLHILHICVLSPQCGWSCTSLNFLLDQKTSNILSKCEPFLHCGWAYGLSEMSNLTKWLLALDTVVCPIFALGDHVGLQITRSTKWLLAFWTNVHLSSTVEEQTRRLCTLPQRWRGTLSTEAFLELRYLKCNNLDFNLVLKTISTFTFYIFLYYPAVHSPKRLSNVTIKLWGHICLAT